MKKLALLLLFVLPFLLHAESHVVISMNDGLRHSFKLKNVDSVYFSNNDTIYDIKTNTFKEYQVIIENESESVLKENNKTEIKILDIGNSFTDNATAYIPDISKSIEADLSKVSLYKLVMSGASFKDWYDCYKGMSKKKYSYSKIIGNDVKVVGKRDTLEGGYINNELFLNVLKKQWDVIVIHQVSNFSMNYKEWGSKKNNGYLADFLGMIYDRQPNAKIIFLLTHVSNKIAEKSGMSTKEVYKIMLDSYFYLQENYGIKNIIPVGTSIENLRNTSLYTEEDISSDNHHLRDGVSKYTSSLTYYESVLSKITGKGIIDLKYNTKKVSSEDFINSLYSAYFGCYFWNTITDIQKAKRIGQQ